MVVITGSSTTPAFAFPTVPAQADRDHELVINAFTVPDIRDTAPISGGSPGMPDPPAAAVAGVEIGIVAGESFLSGFQFIGTGRPKDGRYSYPLHWLILSLGTQKERSVSSPEHPRRVWIGRRKGINLLGRPLPPTNRYMKPVNHISGIQAIKKASQVRHSVWRRVQLMVELKESRNCHLQ